MLKIVHLVLAIALVCPLSAQAQDLPKAQKLQGIDFYRGLFCRHKPGMVDQAMEVVYNYFVKADQRIGRAVIPFDPQTGPWDHIVFFPLATGVEELTWEITPANERWWVALAEITGGTAQAQETWKRYQETIERCEWHLLHRRRF